MRILLEGPEVEGDEAGGEGGGLAGRGTHHHDSQDDVIVALFEKGGASAMREVLRRCGVQVHRFEQQARQYLTAYHPGPPPPRKVLRVTMTEEEEDVMIPGLGGFSGAAATTADAGPSAGQPSAANRSSSPAARAVRLQEPATRRSPTRTRDGSERWIPAQRPRSASVGRSQSVGRVPQEALDRELEVSMGVSQHMIIN